MSAAEKLPHLFSEPELADYLGISTITLARYRKAGKIGCIMVGPYPKYTEHHITAAYTDCSITHRSIMDRLLVPDSRYAAISLPLANNRTRLMKAHTTPTPAGAQRVVRFR